MRVLNTIHAVYTVHLVISKFNNLRKKKQLYIFQLEYIHSIEGRF